ncbi:relaxase domain-containing protein, partial [Aeromicrobium piscarium]
MSLHKLTAGRGYDYLTRQVAAVDGTDKGHTSLATYYAEKGESPGRWVGSGLGGIDGLSAGDVVTAEQMKSLFAYGLHPLADARLAALPPDATTAEIDEPPQVSRRILVSWKDADHAEEDRSEGQGAVRAAGAGASA